MQAVAPNPCKHLLFFHIQRDEIIFSEHKHSNGFLFRIFFFVAYFLISTSFVLLCFLFCFHSFPFISYVRVQHQGQLQIHWHRPIQQQHYHNMADYMHLLHLQTVQLTLWLESRLKVNFACKNFTTKNRDLLTENHLITNQIIHILHLQRWVVKFFNGHRMNKMYLLFARKSHFPSSLFVIIVFVFQIELMRIQCFTICRTRRR